MRLIKNKMKNNTINKILYYILNSHFWYHVYYKHTNAHKNELKRIRDDVIERMPSSIKEKYIEKHSFNKKNLKCFLGLHSYITQHRRACNNDKVVKTDKLYKMCKNCKTVKWLKL
jgi:uncharacterized protein (UPF0248 family)